MHGQPQQQRSDGHVDQEDPAPAGAVDEQAADDGADGQRGAGDGAPHAEREAALATLELVREQGERGGEHGRRSDALGAARDVEGEPGARRAARCREQCEGEQAGGEDRSPADPVGERAGREQRRGEGEGVGVDHPLQLGEAGVEIVADDGEGDVDDGDVEQQHRRARRHDGEREPPV